MTAPADKPAGARREAARLLAAWLRDGSFPDRELASIAKGRAAVTELVFGVLRRLRALQFLRSKLAERRPRPEVEAVLLVALYELFHLDDTPDFAAVHEAVEIARGADGPQSAAFVNAVLRRAQRDADALRDALAGAPLAVRLSHPDALVNRWTTQYGEAAAIALCEWNNQRPETVLHIVRSKITPDEFNRTARDVGIQIEPHPARPTDCFMLPRGVAVENVPGYREGFFIVQDASTLGAVDLLAPQPGETILDACASPGGKAAAIWDRMNGAGTLAACDLHEDRLARLRENFTRLGMTEAKIIQADASDAATLAAALESVGAKNPDGILLDVPCSNTGVLRRRADARWRFDEKRIAELTSLQAKILNAAATLIRPGGRIVYSTCSLEAAENEKQVKRFLVANPAFKLAGETKSLPPGSMMDGAYAARLDRSA